MKYPWEASFLWEWKIQGLVLFVPYFQSPMKRRGANRTSAVGLVKEKKDGGENQTSLVHGKKDKDWYCCPVDCYPPWNGGENLQLRNQRGKV